MFQSMTFIGFNKAKKVHPTPLYKKEKSSNGAVRRFFLRVRGKDATTTTTTKVMEVVAPSTPIVDKPTQSEIEEVVDEQEAEVSEELPAVQVVEVVTWLPSMDDATFVIANPFGDMFSPLDFNIHPAVYLKGRKLLKYRMVRKLQKIRKTKVAFQV